MYTCIQFVFVYLQKCFNFNIFNLIQTNTVSKGETVRSVMYMFWPRDPLPIASGSGSDQANHLLTGILYMYTYI